MTDNVGFVYWCDGAGHAARCIPVLKELESRDIEVSVAGGGPGKKFVEMNGYEHPDLTHVAVKGSTPLSFLKHTFGNIIPNIFRRTKELNRWMKEEDPDKVVTDDLFAMFVAIRHGKEFHRIDHLTPSLFGPVWGIPLKIYNKTALLFGEQIIVTSLWKEEKDPEGYTRVDPLAQEGESDDEIEEYDVLINPGTHGENFDKIKQKLEEKGFDVRQVGDDDWETKPSMTPYTEKADVVICTGFSSIADTVVAGTSCIIYPFLPFQKAIAEKVEEKNLKGISKATTVDEVVEKVQYHTSGSGESPEYDNGAEGFVDAVLDK
jgi:UDP-N-acetylglucosamine:LPS N-acetylglucosamine transferase